MCMKFTPITNPSQEDWFDFWLEELKEAGYIKKVLDQNISGWRIYEGESIPYEESKILYEGSIRERTKIIKKKFILHRPVDYTPDRVIFWTKFAKDIFFTDVDEIVNGNIQYFLGQKTPDGDYISVVDVKSPFAGKHSSDVSFSIKKKWVWVKERIYVNQAVMYPSKPLKNVAKYLWPSTFTPKRFLLSDKLTKARAIPSKKGKPNWVPVSLVDFLQTRKASNN